MLRKNQKGAFNDFNWAEVFLPALHFRCQKA